MTLFIMLIILWVRNYSRVESREKFYPFSIMTEASAGISSTVVMSGIVLPGPYIQDLCSGCQLNSSFLPYFICTGSDMSTATSLHVCHLCQGDYHSQDVQAYLQLHVAFPRGQLRLPHSLGTAGYSDFLYGGWLLLQ